MFSWDVETTGLGPEAELVCLSAASKKGKKLYLREDGLDFLESCLELGDQLIGHNVGQDFLWAISARPRLQELVFAAYEANRVHDTLIREKLLNISDGTLMVGEDEDGEDTKQQYRLEDLAQKYLRKTLVKGADSWRLRYGELVGVPLSAWPIEAIRYAEDDAVSTFDVFEKQARRAQGSVTNEFDQVRADFCLKLMSAHGMITDSAAVEALGKNLEEAYQRLKLELKEAGIFRPDRVMKSGPRKGQTVEQAEDTKKVQAMVVEAYALKQMECPLTEGGAPARDEKTLRLSGSPILKKRGEFGAVAKNHDTYLPLLRKGSTGVIRAGFDVLKWTGRTSSFGPNFQNLPVFGGIRECFIARPGTVFSFADYSGIELVTWAECCLELLGFSDMAKALNSDLDAHTYQAGIATGTPYEELLALVKAGDEKAAASRQGAKAVNFGLPGMLGAKALRVYAEDTYNVVMTLPEAEKAVKDWKKTWSEAQPYLDLAKKASQRGWVKVPFSNRIRGKPRPTQAANTPFQGLASDGMKEALWLLAKAMYLDSKSPLYGARFVAMIHDETILEIPEERAHEGALEHHRLMKVGMERFIKRVKVKTGEPAIARRWFKGARSVYDSAGRLVPYEPRGRAA